MFNYGTFNQHQFNGMPEGSFGRWFAQRYITSNLPRTTIEEVLPEEIIPHDLPDFTDDGYSIPDTIIPQEDLLTPPVVDEELPEITYDDVEKAKRDMRDSLKDFE